MKKPKHIKHQWEKTNLMTLAESAGCCGIRTYDTYQCVNCGISGRKYGQGSIVRSRQFKAEHFRFCDTSGLYTPSQPKEYKMSEKTNGNGNGSDNEKKTKVTGKKSKKKSKNKLTVETKTQAAPDEETPKKSKKSKKSKEATSTKEPKAPKEPKKSSPKKMSRKAALSILASCATASIQEKNEVGESSPEETQEVREAIERLFLHFYKRKPKDSSEISMPE